MEIYRLKLIEEELYVKGVIFNPLEKVKIEIIPTIEINESAWWEEDKAKIICDMLNETKIYGHFIIEKVND